MKKYASPLLLLCLFLSGLILGSLFYTLIANDSATIITIGVPNNTGAVDFTKSSSLSTSDDIHTVLFSLINAETTHNSVAPETTPSAVIVVSAKGSNVSYAYSLWLDIDGMIIVNHGNSYKIIPSAYNDTLTSLIQQHIAPYRN